MNRVNERAKLVVFDMDSALLQERFIDACAKEFKFSQALNLLRQIDKDPVSLGSRIASFLTGKNINDLYEIAATIPLLEDLDVVVEELKNRGCIVGVISDSYQSIVEFIGKRIKVDFSLANELRIQGEYITGELLIPPYFIQKGEGICKHRVCKTNALRYVCEEYNIPLKHSIFAGDAENDACLAKHAGTYVSLSASSVLCTEPAKKYFVEKSLNELLMYAT